jgi:hypothetical protein
LKTTSEAYIVPISASLFQSTIPSLMDVSNVTITNDVPEGMAACPVAMAFSAVSAHGVGFHKVVPGSQKLYRPSRGMLASKISVGALML